MSTFAELLKRYREETGQSQRALSRSSGVNPAIISRMESGDRSPSGPDQVMALARALDLDAGRSDSLLASAGYWPRAILSLGPQDETLRTVANVLASPQVSKGSRLRFRRTVQLLAEQWLGSTGETEGPSRPETNPR